MRLRRQTVRRLRTKDPLYSPPLNSSPLASSFFLSQNSLYRIDIQTMGFRPFIGTLFFVAPLNGPTYVLKQITTCSNRQSFRCPNLNLCVLFIQFFGQKVLRLFWLS